LTRHHSLEAQKVKDYLKRPEDVIRAVRSLQRLGLSLSLPYQTPSGEMFFEINGQVLTVAQMLKLLDQNQLDREGIRQFSAKGKKKNAGERKVYWSIRYEVM
jgi:hypothetical protein